MTRDAYEHHRRRLDEQLQSGIELLKAAHARQVRALEMVWMLEGGGDVSAWQPQPGEAAVHPAETPRASAPSSTPQQQPQSPRRGAWDLMEDIQSALPALPEVFDRNHVRQALGYDPDRTSLYRVLRQLAGAGVLTVQRAGSGKVPTQYRKNAGSGSEPAV